MKNFKRILILLLAVTVMFCFFACNETEDPCKEHLDENKDGKCDVCGEEVTVGPVDEDEIVLIEDGVFNFQIVLGDDVDAKIRLILDKLNKNIKAFGIEEISIVSDKADTVQETEVLIGTVKSRGEEYNYNRYSLGNEGYAVTPVNGKVIVTGGSYATLVYAVEEFVYNILGITEDTLSIKNVNLNSENSVLEIQDNYFITSITIGGNEIKDYKIVTDSSKNNKFSAPLKNAAKKLQEHFYAEIGYYLEVVDIEDVEDGEKAIYLCGYTKENGDAGKNGFRVREDDGSLYIECVYHNSFEDAFNEYFTTKISAALDEKIELPEFSSEKNLGIVYYEDFGAKGDGKTDDFQALKKTHDFANEGGQTVYGKSGATYYVKNVTSEIKIQTNTNWKGAKILSDETNVTAEGNSNKGPANNSFLISCGLFKVESPIKNQYATSEQLEAIRAAKDENGYVYVGLESERVSGLTKTTNIGFAPGFDAFLIIENKNNNNYLRYGYTDSVGQRQREVVKVNANGDIDKTTPLLHDYTDITSITIRSLDLETLEIGNGTIESIASCINLNGGYYTISRGIAVTRPNVRIYNVEHIITGEIPRYTPVKVNPTTGVSEVVPGYSYNEYTGIMTGPDGKSYTGSDITPFIGHSYSGVVSVDQTTDVRVENCIFQARVLYREGTYDISASLSNNIQFVDCTQSNFFEKDSNGDSTGIPNLSLCWGVSGTNYCKNLEFLNCSLTRYDAHAGVTNGKIIGGEVAVVRLIGGGEFIMEGVTVHARATPIQLREDYGASFNGDILIKDCTFINAVSWSVLNTLISAPSPYWDMGYKTVCPNITIDNIELVRLKADEGKNIAIFGGDSPGTFNPDKQKPYRGFLHYDGAGILNYEVNRKNKDGYEMTYASSKPISWFQENVLAETGKLYGVPLKNCKFYNNKTGDFYTYDEFLNEFAADYLEKRALQENPDEYTYDQYLIDNPDQKYTGGDTSVIVVDIKNRFPYYAPEYITVKNCKDKGFKFVLYRSSYFNETLLTDEDKVVIREAIK